MKEEFLMLRFIFVISGYDSVGEEDVDEVNSTVTDLMAQHSINNDDILEVNVDLDDCGKI